MHFHKYPYPANFEFTAPAPNASFRTQKGSYRLHVEGDGADVYHIQVTGKGWETSDSLAGLRFGKARKGLEGDQTRLVFTKNGGFSLETKDGAVLLASAPGRFFGQCGEASVFEFLREADAQFYGMGEKLTGLEHSGEITKFWNTDIWGDFHWERFINGRPAPDPAYVSIPYLILKRGNTYLGLLLDNPHAAFISTKQTVSIAGQMDLAGGEGRILLGAEQGQPNLYLLHGPSLAELTRRMQRLVGETPLPPAWALGYHQCRWGYQSAADLQTLDARFREHGIPVDGLWLDIEYMERYKVFTLDKAHFPAPRETFAALAKAGRKVVPILDPGVKLEKGYGVYERGQRAEAFCQNPQGRDYVGLVWPGETVFPDFSLESARAWWAQEVARFARLGIRAAWLDMNDPSTGPVENQDMLFQHGAKNHSSFHNQYALGMAMASRAGFLKASPSERPFLLSRSGFTGSNRYTAIWTGDNYSNYHHLKSSIATTLNLALSGIPFNGPDAGGFGGDTTPELISDWFKAGFLFPFFRNHSVINSRQQEPWAFGKKTLAVLRRYIQLRYRLRPYLYQLFARHEQTGEAILRPLFYDFQDTARLPLGRVDDQFMVGPWIMQAPFVEEKQASRTVVLPGGQKWYDASEGRWIAGGRKITVRPQAEETPLYIRDGAILPLARLAPEEAGFHAGNADFRIFLSRNAKTATRYVFDDGATFAYQKGKRSEVEISVQRTGTALAIETALLSGGYGPGDFTFTTETAIQRVRVNGTDAVPCPAQGVAFGRGKTVTWQIAAR
ncbi:MAG: glycoside hydrolase family 31 protein [Chthoniobacteraceae bacterium]|nr:glycoside hydrolase family 31 protein [Chthoniobacteraceae bacterium]